LVERPCTTSAPQDRPAERHDGGFRDPAERREHGLETRRGPFQLSREQVAVAVEDDRDRRMADSGCDLVRAGARRGPQADGGVTEVMRSQRDKLRRGDRGSPDALAPRAGSERHARWPRKDQGVAFLFDISAEVSHEFVVGDLAGEGHRPPAGPRLWRAEMHVAANLDCLLGDSHRAPQKVQSTPPKPCHLGESQATVGLHKDECPIPRVNSFGEASDLGRGEETHLLRFDLGQRHLVAGRGRQEAAVDGGAQHLSHDLVRLLHGAGARPCPLRSATQARTSTCVMYGSERCFQAATET
jgi:hypothetical protein